MTKHPSALAVVADTFAAVIAPPPRSAQAQAEATSAAFYASMTRPGTCEFWVEQALEALAAGSDAAAAMFTTLPPAADLPPLDAEALTAADRAALRAEAAALARPDRDAAGGDAGGDR